MIAALGRVPTFSIEHESYVYISINAIMFRRAALRVAWSCPPWPRKSKTMHFWEIEKLPRSLDVMDRSIGFAGRALTALRVLQLSSAGVSTVDGWSRQRTRLCAFPGTTATIRLF